MKPTDGGKLGQIRVRVEARRARKKSNNKYPFLDLDFVDEEPLEPHVRMLYALGSVGCIICAVIGAVFPVLPAIPFWILAAICMSHAFPKFGIFLRNTRLYKWLIEKLNEPQEIKKRRIMKRAQKDRYIVRITIGLAVFYVAVYFLPLPVSDTVALVVASTIVSAAWVVSWAYLYLYVREPEASINMTARRAQAGAAKPQSK